MTHPDIAVMMMTYNSADDIRKSIESLAAQTYKNFHLVFVDDCSTDKTFQIAQEYKERFCYVTMVQNEKNKGVIVNLCDTLRLVEQTASKAEFFIWTCADDWWEPTFLEKVRTHLILNPDVAVCQSWFDTLHKRTGKVTNHKLVSVRAGKYKDAKRIFLMHHSDVDPTPYNFVLHGLMRMSVMRSVYPDSIKAIESSASTELSGVAAMLLQGGIDIYPECLLHRGEDGSFAENNPHDPFSKYYHNLALRFWAVCNQLPHLVKMGAGKSSFLFVMLLWWQVLRFYSLMPAGGRVKMRINRLVGA